MARKLFKDDDSWFDIVTKIATAIGVIFGIWAYFNTIHPIFVKEKELLEVKKESEMQKLFLYFTYVEDVRKYGEEIIKELNSNYSSKSLINDFKGYATEYYSSFLKEQREKSSFFPQTDEKIEKYKHFSGTISALFLLRQTIGQLKSNSTPDDLLKAWEKVTTYENMKEFTNHKVWGT